MTIDEEQKVLSKRKKRLEFDDERFCFIAFEF